MIKKTEGFDSYVAVSGFKNVDVKDVNGFLNLVQENVGGVHVQLFDARLIAGWEHLFFAALNALNAFKNKRSISNSLAVEALLYASAQRQIRKAVEIIGIKPHSPQVAVLIIAETEERATTALETFSRIMGGERDDSVLDLTDEKKEDVKRLFEISDVEIEASRSLVDLVIEHMALLAVKS